MSYNKSLTDVLGGQLCSRLADACKYPEYFPKLADLLFIYHARNPDFDLKTNLLISLVKTAVQSQGYHPAEIYGKAKDLIMSLGLDEDVRVKLYRALFDQNGIKALSIQIHRNID